LNAKTVTPSFPPLYFFFLKWILIPKQKREKKCGKKRNVFLNHGVVLAEERWWSAAAGWRVYELWSGKELAFLSKEEDLLARNKNLWSSSNFSLSFCCLLLLFGIYYDTIASTVALPG